MQQPAARTLMLAHQSEARRLHLARLDAEPARDPLRQHRLAARHRVRRAGIARAAASSAARRSPSARVSSSLAVIQLAAHRARSRAASSRASRTRRRALREQQLGDLGATDRKGEATTRRRWRAAHAPIASGSSSARSPATRPSSPRLAAIRSPARPCRKTPFLAAVERREAARQPGAHRAGEHVAAAGGGHAGVAGRVDVDRTVGRGDQASDCP